MKKLFCFFITVCCACSTVCLTACSKPEEDSVDMQVRMLSTSDLADAGEMLSNARAAVVGISVDYPDSYSIGSGFAISGDGLILTNNHVVEGGGEITLYYADKTIGRAKMLWADPGLDVAVLQSERAIPYLETNIDGVSIGEPVYALGTPLTLEFKHTITHGIVSATNRTLESQSFSGELSFMQSLIQHDAAINPGNSGGPLINSSGQVVGINTLKATEGEGIGFAVPIFMSLYICIESADTISPFIFFASSIESPVFPDAVGPQITITCSFCPFGDVSVWTFLSFWGHIFIPPSNLFYIK